MPYVLPSNCPAASRFGSTADVSILTSSVVVSTPASASVDTTGLSTISTSGELPCCAASNALFVRSVVSKPVRFTVTPASVPHLVNNFTQSDESSNCGYGSQMLYVLGFEPPALDDESLFEQAAVRQASVTV